VTLGRSSVYVIIGICIKLHTRLMIRTRYFLPRQKLSAQNVLTYISLRDCHKLFKKNSKKISLSYLVICVTSYKLISLFLQPSYDKPRFMESRGRVGNITVSYSGNIDLRSWTRNSLSLLFPQMQHKNFGLVYQTSHHHYQ
jgi:hypothetical protein